MTEYVGRFAPSPTGPLHFGSLVTAIASFLEARVRGGRWLVRIEDIDTPRNVRGAAQAILDTLHACGLAWDTDVVYQCTRLDAYNEALEHLRHTGLVYPCACSRRELDIRGVRGRYGLIYPGTCRAGLPENRAPRSLRLRTHNEGIVIDDRIQGRFQQRLESEVGDFVLRRADGIVAYQLAVVVDDAWQGITEVVRGSDLLDSTPRQYYLQRLLGLPTPSYAHVPVVVDRSGAKLSKQTLAAPVDPQYPSRAIWQALSFLDQSPPEDLRNASPRQLLNHAMGVWSLERIQPTLGKCADQTP